MSKSVCPLCKSDCGQCGGTTYESIATKSVEKWKEDLLKQGKSK